jgi:hypothetical protein
VCAAFLPFIFNSFFQIFLSDGTLARRFYVVIRKEKWSLYLPAALVILIARESLTKWASDGVQLTDFNFNVVLCWSADGQHLAIYSNEEFTSKRYCRSLLRPPLLGAGPCSSPIH